MAINSSPSSTSSLDTLFYHEDEELVHLFTKEQLQITHPWPHDPSSLLLARKDAVDWILKVKSHFGFTHLTSILAISYLDRFLSTLHNIQQDKPWMIQLIAVTSLSLAAKLHETQVPSLLHLQVEDTNNYMFEPKNIQKMELLMMSKLEWKMNPVTPISFLDHIVRRLGLNTHLHQDFIKTCEDLVLLLVSDSRFVGYPPSVLATAAMLHVIEQVDFVNCVDYQNQLLEVLKTTKEKVKECNEMIVEASHLTFFNLKKQNFNDVDDETIHLISSSSSPSSSSLSSNHYLCQPPIKKTGIEQQNFGHGSLSCESHVDVTSIP